MTMSTTITRLACTLLVYQNMFSKHSQHNQILYICSNPCLVLLLVEMVNPPKNMHQVWSNPDPSVSLHTDHGNKYPYL